MKVYNGFDDLRNNFSKDVLFSCEGEQFKLLGVNKFKNHAPFNTISLINLKNGLIVRVYYGKTVEDWTYKCI